jgi:hypothetical protein
MEAQQALKIANKLTTSILSDVLESQKGPTRQQDKLQQGSLQQSSSHKSTSQHFISQHSSF